MAKGQKNKQQNEPFAEMMARLVAEKATKPVVASREDRKYFLIVSEGTRTEKLYFEYLGKQLPANMVNTVVVDGAGINTVAVVRRAMMLREQRSKNKNAPDYDEVWAVYDKDDFPAKDYRAAIELARKEGIESGHSNESFELWYVLHFADLEAAVGRKVYIERLSNVLKVDYKKSDATIAPLIHKNGNINKAIARGYQLEQLHAGTAAANASPYTRVYVLAERLMAYIENRKPNTTNL
jgi:hypothetical protein